MRWLWWFLIPVLSFVGYMTYQKYTEATISDTTNIELPVEPSKPTVVEKRINVLCKLYNMPVNLNVPDIDAVYINIEGPDAVLHKKYQASLKRYDEYFLKLTAISDDAVKENDSVKAECVLANIASMALNNAFMGSMETPQSYYERSKVFIMTAVLYNKLHKFNTSSLSKDIEPWLKRLADVNYEWLTTKVKRKDSFYYFNGVGYAALGRSTKDEKYTAWYSTVMSTALNVIDTSGTMFSEIRKDKRSLFHHYFAASALIPLAEFGFDSNINWYENGALHRLVKLNVFSMDNPTLFQKLTGVEQDLEGVPGFGWLSVYSKRFGKQPSAIDVPNKFLWLGGDVTLMMGK